MRLCQPKGVRDPPLPTFPTGLSDLPKISQIPRDRLFEPKNWKPPIFHAGPRESLPKVQAPRYPEDPEVAKINAERRGWVKRAFLHAWEGYKANAFGHDETTPVSGKTRDGYNAWGATAIDAL